MHHAVRLCFLLANLMLGGCSGLFFFPDQEMRLTPERAGLAYHDVQFVTPDGLRLHGWFLPGDATAAKAPLCSMLFLHGNAQNISTHIASVWWLPARGVNVFMVDYRGYGRSEGAPDIAGVHIDAEAALDEMTRQPGVTGDRMVVFGQSLGGAIAISAVARSPHRSRLRALIVEGAFSGFRSIMRDKMASGLLTWPLQWIPSLTIDDDYRPLDAVRRLGGLPLLVVHGLNDRVIPPDNARTIYEAAHDPKALWLVPGAAHIEAFKQDDYRNRLIEYLRRRGCIAE